MKRWKRSGALILAAVLSLSLAACGGSEPTPEEILDQTLQNSQEALESLSASVTAQIDMEVQAGDQTQTMETTTAMDMVCFSDPLKLKAETSMDMGELGSFSATVYAQQEGETYTTYTDVGGQWFKETASAELLEQYNASAEMNSYLSSTDQWTFQQEEELDGMTTLKFSGTVTGSQVSALMEEIGVTWHPCHHVGTTVHVAADGVYLGHIVISDQVKPDAKESISALKAAGVRKTVMLTGDAKTVGEAVAAQLGLDEVHAQLLPADKVDQVERLLKEVSPKGALAFVGDGINDAPVLSRADVGIAMGGLGSDAAIEAADIVLMDDKPSKLAQAIAIARRTLAIVRQNIVFALAVKLLVLVLSALGQANLWQAVFADVGVSVIAILNAMRAMRNPRNKT